MNTWGIIFISTMICPLMMIIFGVRFLKLQPKLNGICGVRVKEAMKNEETWNFAHEYCGKLWINIGLIMGGIIIILMLVFINFSEIVIGIAGLVICLIQCVIFLSTFCFVKKALRKKFSNSNN